MRTDTSIRGAEGSALSMVDVVRFATGNLILDDEGDWWALYRLRGTTYDLLSTSGKKEVFSAIESALGTLSTRVKILSVVRNFREQDYIRNLKAMNPDAHVWQKLQDMVAEKVGKNRPVDREFYLGVRLRPSVGRFSEAVDRGSRLVDRWAKRLWKVPIDFREEELERMKHAAANIRGRFGTLIMRDATPYDLQWLVKRNPYRAVGEPPTLAGWQPKLVRHSTGGTYSIFTPSLGDVRNLVGDVPWEAEIGKLSFYHGDGIVSHQRFLAISSMPMDRLRHPGSEWGYMDLPVDVCFDFDVIPPQAAERHRKSKSRKAKEQIKHVQEGGGSVGVGLSEAARADAAAELQHNQGKPLLYCHTTIGLAAETESRLDAITADVRQHFKNMQIGVSLTRSNQVEAFCDFFPVGPRRLTDFREPIAAATLAGAMPIGDSALGDGQGFYIGYPKQQPNGVIAYDPALPMQRGMSGACAVVGDLGAGKTMTYFCLMLTNALAGRKCLLIDPKGDSEALDNVPAIRGGLKKIQVGADTDTRMPILSVYPEGWDRRTEELLRGFQLDIMETKDDKAKANTIRLVTREFMRETEGRDRRIRGLLEKYHKVATSHDRSDRVREKAKEVRDEFEFWMDDSLASTVLCDADVVGDQGIARAGSQFPITVLQTFNLALPSQKDLDRGNLGESQRVGQAILSVVAASATQMASEHRLSRNKPFKLLGFDEAWRFLANAEGSALLDYLIREGRSQNVAAFIMTQLWRDVVGIKDLISIRFMGRQQQSDEDVRLGLDVMGIDPDQRTISQVKAFSKGDFIHQDMFGRTNVMHFDVTPEEWLDQLSSTPQEVQAKAQQNGRGQAASAPEAAGAGVPA